MKVILKEKVKSLGNIGEIHNVAEGFARNYLVPRNLAMIADDANKKAMADYKRMLNKKVDAERSKALELKKKIDGVNMSMEKKVGANGKLFGMVTTIELASELEKKAIVVEKRQISVDRPIKQTGTYEVKVKLFSDVEANFQVKIEMDAKQHEEMLKLQKQKEAEKKKAKTLKKEDAVEVEAKTESEE